MDNIILAVKNIKKTFGPVVALEDASINFYKGKVNMLFGENGAGKSTLMNVITGLLSPDSGKIILNGQDVIFSNIHVANKAGIEIIHQELKLAEDLTVAENIFLNNLKTKFGLILNYRKMNFETENILKSLGSNINPKTIVNTLSIAEKQMVEIAKALSKDAKILIMDEPTSSIGEEETQNLFRIIRELKTKNIAIVYITHRMKEIDQIADYITIFRDGKFIGEYLKKNISEDEIIHQMVGRELGERFFVRKPLPTQPLVKIENLNNQFLSNISLTINSNEILVISGLVGSRRTEFAKTIISEIKKSSGQIYYQNKEIHIKSVNKAISKGIFYLPEDRKKEGLVLDKSIEFNISLASLKLLTKSFKFFLNEKEEKTIANDYINKLKIKCHNSKQIVSNLSGGNQQKVVIAKALLTAPKLIIFDEPTRGVDVGARKEIYEILNELKKNGVAVVVISSDLQEVLGIADRVVVMANGKITADMKNLNLTQEHIMQYALRIEG